MTDMIFHFGISCWGGTRKWLYAAIRGLTSPPETKKGKIGFKGEREV
ncbi:MAG: hypothetical protein HZC48_07360 [Nitrospirae bacterium]|nr:hypothetical protein [Nitrospirota bacterium]